MFSIKLSRFSWGGRLFLLVGVFLATLCVAAFLSIGSFARDAEARSRTFTGQSITNSDPTQTGRLFRDEPPSTCASPTAFPGLNDSDPHHFDAFTLRNGRRGSCVTVTLTPSASCPAFPLQSAAYRPSFNPANIAENYRADIGASPDAGVAKSYSFRVPRRATFTVVVNEVTPGVGCGYTLKVSGLSRRR